MAKPVFGSLARRPAHNHASDKRLLLCELSLELLQLLVNIFRHTSQR
jgi:hypothetical protein